MPNVLGLPDWQVLERKQNEHDMVITAEFTKPVECCVRCGVTPPNLKKYGVQSQSFMDTPIHGKRVAIEIMRQRYKCLDCEKTFQQPLPDMDEKRTMTRRCLDYIRRRSLERTFSEVATDVGLDEKTVRNIFNDYVGELNDVGAYSIDPASIPDAVLTSEWARRQAAKRRTFGAGSGRPKIMRPCPSCGAEFSASDLRRHRHRRKTTSNPVSDCITPTTLKSE